MKLQSSLAFLLTTLTLNATAADKPAIRVGVLAFGTLSWELAALKNAQQLDALPFTLETVTMATPQAGKIALQSGTVDMIVSDWIAVSNQRSSGGDETFYPYSNNSGALLVAPNSGIKTLADLTGKKLGIAGGELDKNWLLLKALGNQQGVDLDAGVEKVYGAPSLLAQQLTSGRLDAIITYWHAGAKLEAQGYTQLLSGEDILQQLGISAAVPSLGYVFKSAWGKQHGAALQAFFTATQTAKNQLCTSDSAWQQITPLLSEVSDAHNQVTLRQRYCQGRVSEWGAANQQAAEKIYTLLHQYSHSKLTGNAASLQSGTFWSFE